MRTGLAQALWFAAHRTAFGKTLIEHALMRQVLADLALESEAATLLALRVTRSFDEAAGQEEAALYSRLATPVAKYWLNKRVIQHVAECMECHGGVGYTEEWPIARFYRQTPLNGIWEGSGNVICLDVLRALSRSPQAGEAVFDEIKRAGGANAHLDRAIEALETQLTQKAIEEAGARRFVESLALVLQASLLIQHAPVFVSDAFCATRLGEKHSSYGAFTANADVSAIIARAMPTT
jgi:putative acyl-CoA dehydrogenase